MASSSGNSSTSPQLQNSDPVMDQRKRKRMQSNRESARRSRMRKQKLLDDLTVQVAELRKENNQILTRINVTTQQYLSVEADNTVLRAQMTELTHRLDSLNEILNFINSSAGVYDAELHTGADTFLNPLNLPYVSQPIVASAEMLLY